MIDKLWILIVCSAITLLVAYLNMQCRIEEAKEAKAVNKETKEQKTLKDYMEE